VRIAAMSLLLTVFAVGCGSGSRVGHSNATQRMTAAALPAASDRGFLAVRADEAVFINWTQISRYAVGRLYQGSPSERSVRFTGAIRGALITLTPRRGNDWNGTLDRPGMTMSSVDSSGVLQTFVFHPATGASYLVALNAVRARIASKRTLAAQVRHEPAAVRRAFADETRVDQDTQDLSNALETARMDALSIPNLLANERQDFAAIVRDRRAINACARASKLGQDAAKVNADAKVFPVADATFESAGHNVVLESTLLRKALERAHGDQHLVTGPPQQNDPPSAADPTPASAASTMRHLRATVDRDLNQATGLRVHSSADAARAATNCRSQRG
jgi:hypothetical protein